jgi:type IV pilus assembly protein PilX
MKKNLSNFSCSAPASKQRGATLLVSLVLLLLLTIIGISSIEDVSLQSNMVRNSQFKMQAFNIAFSESNAQYDTINQNFLSTIIQSNAPYSYGAAELAMLSGDNPFQQDVVMNYDGNAGGVVAKSASKAMDLTQFDTYYFSLESNAALTNTGTRSDQVQGIQYIGPKMGTANNDQAP